MIKETRTATLNLTSNDENKMILEGYAIVFNEETLIGDELSYSIHKQIKTSTKWCKMDS